MDIFLLFIRLLGFAVTFYLLLEFVIICNVSTAIAGSLTFLTAVIVLFVFIIMKRYDVVQCSLCKQSIPKSNFGHKLAYIRI
jgi:hypothetical protein